ncbi:MAG: alpha-glucan family phosphorylase [Gammaproteobacteria bacterium]|nr:alpha-glucan family phosphorylase [Gammaproteobacteria bacterium]
MVHTLLPRELPQRIQALSELALDLRWTWSHAGDVLWNMIDADTWERTGNPWIILQTVEQKRLEQLAYDPQFLDELDRLVSERRKYVECPCFFDEIHAKAGIKNIAFFSMEYGLGEALPLYAGGLGVLAGDFMKAASDLGVPLIGVGLLYQEGYFRQMVAINNRQLEIYPYNDPSSLPIQPAESPNGGWLLLKLEMPGRIISLRVWRAMVGCVTLYLLDSNNPLNSPTDRGITGKLYGDGLEMRLMQEIILGIGGFRLLEILGINVDICHLNEGHAALVVLERARSFMRQNATTFTEALWATRAGNIFTTHTPVAAGFDSFTPAMMEKYFPEGGPFLAGTDFSLQDVLALGRCDSTDHSEPFNMAYLAMRGCSWVNGVSQLHGKVSQTIFHKLFPRWPEDEVPVTYITNGVHMPSWDSPWADRLWSQVCGKERWLGDHEPLTDAIARLSDEELWNFCGKERLDLIHHARERLAWHIAQRGAPREKIAQAEEVLDPNVMIVGFARRFTAYKRPTLLLQDPERLIRLLTHPTRPMQLVVAGKAHPQDAEGKEMVKAWVDFANRPEVRRHVVFLEDYDIELAQQMVQGVDVWINTPRRPWEACGTSGMKVLVNGGLNVSELDGWWAEAYAPKFGWSIGDGKEHDDDPQWDAYEAEQLYTLLEDQITPLFYQRDEHSIPRNWVSHMRASMSQLAPQFSSNRMLQQYVDTLYRPAAAAFHTRSAEQAAQARQIAAWHARIEQHWDQIHFDTPTVSQHDNSWHFTIAVYLGDLTPDDIRVELYAAPMADNKEVKVVMESRSAITGAINGYFYEGEVPATRPKEHFTPRIIAHHPAVFIPMEVSRIAWQH